MPPFHHQLPLWQKIMFVFSRLTEMRAALDSGPDRWGDSYPYYTRNG